jgi:citrate lyase subunit beta/citryl-CoA lyase
MPELVRRSNLIMPVNQRRFIEKAYQRGADAITLDLEDSVPPAEKEPARALIREAIPLVARGGADVFVRINKSSVTEDLDASIYPGLTGIAYPKAESAEELQAADQIINRLEVIRGIPAGSIQLAVSVETALGVLKAWDIARACSRIISLQVGTEDLAYDLGIEATVSGEELYFAKASIILIARAAGIIPMGLMGTLVDFQDLEGLQKSAREAYRRGFRGASIIHPAQVPVCNEAYAPTAAEIAHAQRIIEAFEAGLAQGTAAVAIDGRMIDIPIADKARRLLARAAAIAQKEAQKAAALQKG